TREVFTHAQKTPGEGESTAARARRRRARASARGGGDPASPGAVRESGGAGEEPTAERHLVPAAARARGARGARPRAGGRERRRPRRVPVPLGAGRSEALSRAPGSPRVARR